MSKKIFDFCIGNPPYQIQQKSTRDKPIYNNFMEASYKISDSSVLITPGRFLFNAGATPKDWNEKMLNDPHFKVLKYYPNASDVFPNVVFSGGVVISYYNNHKKFDPIESFF